MVRRIHPEQPAVEVNIIPVDSTAQDQPSRHSSWDANNPLESRQRSRTNSLGRRDSLMAPSAAFWTAGGGGGGGGMMSSPTASKMQSITSTSSTPLTRQSSGHSQTGAEHAIIRITSASTHNARSLLAAIQMSDFPLPVTPLPRSPTGSGELFELEPVNRRFAFALSRGGSTHSPALSRASSTHSDTSGYMPPPSFVVRSASNLGYGQPSPEEGPAVSRDAQHQAFMKEFYTIYRGKQPHSETHHTLIGFNDRQYEVPNWASRLSTLTPTQKRQIPVRKSDVLRVQARQKKEQEQIKKQAQERKKMRNAADIFISVTASEEGDADVDVGKSLKTLISAAGKLMLVNEKRYDEQLRRAMHDGEYASGPLSSNYTSGVGVFGTSLIEVGARGAGKSLTIPSEFQIIEYPNVEDLPDSMRAHYREVLGTLSRDIKLPRTMRERRMMEAAIKPLEAFKKLGDYVVKQMCHCLTLETRKAGQYVFRQGDVGNCWYGVGLRVVVLPCAHAKRKRGSASPLQTPQVRHTQRQDCHFAQ
jgi:hypothetical protein